jgi:hypothetical protein
MDRQTARNLVVEILVKYVETFLQTAFIQVGSFQRHRKNKLSISYNTQIL